MVHRTRELLVKQRTMSVNALRGHLAEFGLVVAKGIERVDELLDLANNDASLPEEAGKMVELLALHLEGLDRSIEAAERKSSRPMQEARPVSCSIGSPASAR